MDQNLPIVLLIEGDIVARFPLAQYLRQCGFVVVEAVDADEAKVALKTPAMKIEVVIADMASEGVDFSLRHWARTENLDVRILLAPTLDRLVEHAGVLCNQGPARAKPYEHHLLRDQIRQAMARRERALRGGGQAGDAGEPGGRKYSVS